MREKKLIQLASNDTYAGGAAVGLTNKISPPDQAFTDGRRPSDAYAAQWQNYVDYYFQKQIERSANVPFQNWQDFSAAIPATTATPRFAFNRNAGLTLVANGVNNSVKYIQDMVDGSAGAPLGIALSPAAGTFVPKCVVALRGTAFPRSFVGGSNSSATSKTIWDINQAGSLAELNTSTPGSVEVLIDDSSTGILYGVVVDANRSVLKRDPSTEIWSAIATLGGGVATPSSSATFAAANNGTLVYATSGTPDVQITYLVSPGVLGTTRVLTGDSSTVLDCRYSVVHGKFMVLTTTHLLLFVDPTQPVYESFPHIGYGGGGVTMAGGCCTDTGCAVWTNGDGALVYVKAWPGDTAYATKFGAFGGSSSGVFARYDGSAIWFEYDTSGTKHLWRSLRVN